MPNFNPSRFTDPDTLRKTMKEDSEQSHAADAVKPRR